MSPVRVFNLKGKQYVAPATACEYLSCTEEILRKHVALGRVKAFKYKNADYIDLDSVEKFLLKRQAMGRVG